MDIGRLVLDQIAQHAGVLADRSQPFELLHRRDACSVGLQGGHDDV
jgi:hypothetical protein